MDDIETSSHYTFNDTRAAIGYTIRVSAADGFNATFASADAAHNDGYFIAHKMNDAVLTGTDAPLKLVGPATTSGKQRWAALRRSALKDSRPVPCRRLAAELNGKISDVIPQGEFEYWALHHSATYTDTNGNVYTGIPLWRLMGWVDDRIPHGPNGFNDAAAIAGYKVIVKAGDGYAKEFTSQQIGKTNAFIVANTYERRPHFRLMAIIRPTRSGWSAAVRPAGTVWGTSLRSSSPISRPPLKHPSCISSSMEVMV